MPTRLAHRWPAATLAALVVVAAASVAVAVIRNPGMLDNPHAGVWAALLVGVSSVNGAAAYLASDAVAAATTHLIINLGGLALSALRSD